MRLSRLPALALLSMTALLLVPVATAEDDITPIESTITHVTVYPEWAYVTRRAVVRVPAGVSRLSLEGLPAWIDSESIRVSTGDAAGVTLLGATTQTTYLTRSTEDQVNDAEAAVTDLRDQIEDLNNELAVMEQQKKFLDGLVVFAADRTPREAAVREVDVAEMAEVQEHLRKQMLETIQGITAIRRQVRELQPELNAAQKRWQDMRGRVRLEQKRIAIDLSAKAETEVTLDVGYLISGASWFPSYDLRTRSDNGEVMLSARAVVQQSTGEDWADARFVLSTIQPYLTREKPELRPWYIGVGFDPSEPAAQTAGSMSPNFRFGNDAAVSRLGSVQKQQFDYNTLNAPAAEAYKRVSLNRDNLLRVIRQVEERGTTVEFAVAGTHSVDKDGTPTAMPIGVATLETTREYSASPSVSRSTYITGQMRNTGAFPVLPGDVRIYTDGSFVARSELPFVAQNERFEVFLGLEERIKVTRELDYTKSSSATWSNRKRLDAAFVIQVQNLRDEPVTVTISDQIPVSRDREVTVRIEETSPRAASEDKGILTWPLTLKAGESQSIRFAFRIEYPPTTRVQAIESLERQIMAK